MVFCSQLGIRRLCRSLWHTDGEENEPRKGLHKKSFFDLVDFVSARLLTRLTWTLCIGNVRSREYACPKKSKVGKHSPSHSLVPSFFVQP
jgi:hypothetical protein